MNTYYTELFGCCNMKHCEKCIISYFIPGALCYYHADAVSRATDRDCITAFLIDLVGCSCFNMQAIRKKYNISGSIVNDACCCCFCHYCALLRDVDEVDYREEIQYR